MSMKKLQTEIDRVLKKVSEGVDTFETIFDKIHSTNNANQKEKYEQDLKKEIKKLQRLRDQIKTWLSSNEIKDKRALLDNRKLIESQMERFKAIEKEMKTKAFSKEGLLQREKMDPKEKEKADACDWISSTVDELSRQIETAEFELETLQGSSRKGKKDYHKQERTNAIENTIERNRFHINRLELMLRLLENDHLETEKVLAIREDVQYYLEYNQDPDFEENEFIYEDLNLEEEEELYAIRTDEYHNEVKAEKETKEEEKPTKRSSKEKDKERDDESLSPAQVTRSPSKPSTSPNPVSTSAEETKPSSPSKPSTTQISSPKSKQDAGAVPTPPSVLKYSAAAAAGAASSLETTTKKSDEKAAEVVPSAWVEPPKIADQSKSVRSPVEPSSTLGSQSMLSSHFSGKSSPSDSHMGSAPTQDMSEARLPSSLADLASSFESIKARAGKEDMLYTHQMLDASLQHVPDLIDSERPKMYQPRMPYMSPNYYPQQPLAIFDNPVLFEKFDMDALFFIFYYQQGTYQQYLAAKELKKQSWRFHKKYLTWFQRHEEPKVITEDYEQGTYIYFDYEGAWCQRKKTEFRFEYRFLEEA
ncbi:Not1 N-terminal domain, CCR4-Not complex component-domain-containing protein [Halteromyces radiatus]|uniref:Not1 N-terminal domain, CCR4-Not complex component-domain-containing protein n=1 Tax=Halteromyces radiatus TaxID=101107 RepID=UPI002220A865|nr:Not1 N-terminal domain, CCR4-Not complex component-domain-containing protein [Halteromyces radiatus]KAI8097640.1 Not1 N-terminal domain, CCR4-Not complex component-domain-containing protein [Halteromyces radiatus]